MADIHDNEWNRVRIQTEAFPSDMGTRVFLDDVEVKAVVNVVFEHPAGELPSVTIEIVPESVEIDGVGLVTFTQNKQGISDMLSEST